MVILERSVMMKGPLFATISIREARPKNTVIEPDVQHCGRPSGFAELKTDIQGLLFAVDSMRPDSRGWTPADLRGGSTFKVSHDFGLKVMVDTNGTQRARGLIDFTHAYRNRF